MQNSLKYTIIIIYTRKFLVISLELLWFVKIIDKNSKYINFHTNLQSSYNEKKNTKNLKRKFYVSNELFWLLSNIYLSYLWTYLLITKVISSIDSDYRTIRRLLNQANSIVVIKKLLITYNKNI